MVVWHLTRPQEYLLTMGSMALTKNLPLITTWTWVRSTWENMMVQGFLYFLSLRPIPNLSSWALFHLSMLKKKEKVLIRQKSLGQGLDMKSAIVSTISPRHSCGEKKGSSNFSVGWQIFCAYWHSSGECVSPQTKGQQNAEWSEIWRISKSHVSQLFPKALGSRLWACFQVYKVEA